MNVSGGAEGEIHLSVLLNLHQLLNSLTNVRFGNRLLEHPFMTRIGESATLASIILTTPILTTISNLQALTFSFNLNTKVALNRLVKPEKLE
ncbi:hypothetical protein D3C71_1989800 [compost metagenome]